MSLPCLNLRCELFTRQIKALRHDVSVIFEAKGEVKARNLHLDASYNCLTLLSIPLVFSNDRFRYDVFKAHISMDNAFPVKPLKSICQAPDTLCNIIYCRWLVISTQVVEIVSEGHFQLLCQEVLVTLRISEAID